MSTAITSMPTNDVFLIQGPKLAKGNNVLNAVHALYFLPENYRMVFTGEISVDQSLYNEVVSLVERDALGERVQFTRDTKSLESTEPDAVIVSQATKAYRDHQVSGDTPEALASAILDVARAAA